MCSYNTSSTSQQKSHPIPVQIVLQFPYPKQLVLDVYKQLLSTGKRSRSAAPATAAGATAAAAAAGGADTASGNGRVTARMLLLAVEAQTNRNFSASPAFGAAFRANDSAPACFAEWWTSSGDGFPVPDSSYFSSSIKDSRPRSPPSPPRPSTHKGGVDGDLQDDAPIWGESSVPAGSAGASPSTSSTAAAATTPATLSPSPQPTKASALSTLPNTTHSAETSTTSAPLAGATKSPVAVSGSDESSPFAASAEARSPDKARSLTQNTSTMHADADDAGERRRRQLQRLRDLRKENQRLKNRRVCLKCGVNPVDLTLLPCGHFCFCQECGNSFATCPLCHKTILADVKTYLS